MIKYRIKGPASTVLYGANDSSGIFLSVIDSNLAHDTEADDHVNAAIAGLGITSKAGSYLNLYTGEQGIGLKVTQKTMIVFLKRYGAAEDQIQTLVDANKSTEPAQYKCLVCQRLTSKSCPSCKTVYYCHFDCQVSDWAVQQAFCKLLPLLPAPKDSFKRVRGVLFPENSTLPQIIYIPIDYNYLSGRFVEVPGFGTWIKEPIHSLAMKVNTLKNDTFLDNSIQISFQGDCDDADEDSKDTSLANQSITKLTNGKQKHNWSGPVIACKRKGIYSEESTDLPFIDIEIADFSDIRDFFLAYSTDVCPIDWQNETPNKELSNKKTRLS